MEEQNHPLYPIDRDHVDRLLSKISPEEQDLVDLGWHQKEFERRSSFAFTVMNLDESRCLGCIYIDPSEKAGYEAKAIFWVRQSEIRNDFDEKLFSVVKSWLSEEWWFTTVAFPGREISWNQWDQLPDK